MVHIFGRSASQDCQPLPAEGALSRLGIKALHPAIRDDNSMRKKRDNRLMRIALL